MKIKVLTLAIALSVASAAHAQLPVVTPAMRPFIAYDAPVVAIRHARVIDGTGRSAVPNQTLILRDGKIESVTPDALARVPAGAVTIDATGKSVLPGLVQMHEHMWMAGPYGLLDANESYPRLYLAAGVTSVRTTGSYNDYIDLKLWRSVQAGDAVGPWMDLTVYMGDIFGAPALHSAEQTRDYLNFWLDSGFTSVKAYRRTRAVALQAAIELAHRRGIKVTGHLCAVTYAQAADMGIDNIEHGFLVATDFMTDRPADRCPDEVKPGIGDIDPRGAQARALVAKLVARRVAITSTLVTWSPDSTGVEMLSLPLREHNARYREQERLDPRSREVEDRLVRNSAIMELEFMRAGGLLLSGTDPAIESIGVIAGYGSARQMELMVENGFTPLEAIKVGTLNGAIYLDRASKIGSIAPGKQADLLLVEGDPSVNISDIRKVSVVFKEGLGYDPQRLRESVRGTVGLH